MRAGDRSLHRGFASAIPLMIFLAAVLTACGFGICSIVALTLFALFALFVCVLYLSISPKDRSGLLVLGGVLAAVVGIVVLLVLYDLQPSPRERAISGIWEANGSMLVFKVHDVDEPYFGVEAIGTVMFRGNDYDLCILRFDDSSRAYASQTPQNRADAA
jgi:multisubunit Na+/H+ antiporter MnhB subunit